MNVNKITFLKSGYLYVIMGIFSIALFILSLHEGMFWDNVLFASEMGNHLYQKGIFNLLLPDAIDPGHPPLLAFILACFWKVLGHSLWVSHLAMLPFIFGFIIQLHRFVSYYVPNDIYRLAAVLLILADPTLSAQLLLVNPEIILLFFFFWALNGILRENYRIKTIALAFLGITTLRGMMLCSGLFLFDLFLLLRKNSFHFKSTLSLRFIGGYLISSLPSITFIAWHYAEKGWVITHPGAQWEGYSHLVSPTYFLYNCGILIYRYIDFGRLFIFLFIGLTALKFKSSIKENANKELFVLSILSVLTIICTSLTITNPMGHRYFVVSYIVLILIAFKLTEHYNRRKTIYIILLTGLFTGNLWIYPTNISHGWDATLAHTPYFGLRRSAIQYLDSNNIKINQVASFFPNETTIDNIDLNGDQRKFADFTGNNEYVMGSTVYNLSHEDRHLLETSYIPVRTFKKLNIDVTIYKKIAH